MSKRQRKPKYNASDYVTGEEFSDGEEYADDEDRPSRPSPKKRAPAKPKPAPIQAPFVDEMHWMIVPPGLIWRDFNTQASTRVAAFDLDGTLVNTRGPNDFARDEHDWQYYNDKVKGTLQELYGQGYKIVIFTNQGGIKSALTGKAATTTKNRIMNLIKDVNVPMIVFMATQTGTPSAPDMNRKPQTGMWQYFMAHCNGGLPVDPQTSFFCGDAAGRDADKVGDSDKLFAANVGLIFKTPEEMFGQAKAPGGGGAADPDQKAAAVSGTHKNQALIEMFHQLAAHVAANPQGDTDKFKISAYKKAAESLTAASFGVTLTNIELAEKLPGIGKGCLSKIREFLETGSLAELADGAGGAVSQQQAANAELAAAFM